MSRDTAEEGAFSASVPDVRPLVLSFVVVIFAAVTQLLAATGVISLSTTQQLTMWLVALGFVVLLWIADMACRAYVTAKAAPPGAVEPGVPLVVQNNGDGHRNPAPRDRAITVVQTNGDGQGKHAYEAEQARIALAAAEEQLEKAWAQADRAEQEARSARARAARAEQEAKSARACADKAELDAKARLVERMASQVADWQKDKAT